MEGPRHILITGGSSGIGEALALAYAQSGIRLSLSGRDRERLASVAERCRARGAEVESALLDVADATAMAEWLALADKIRPLDLVIANAGVALPSGMLQEHGTRVRLTLAVNLMGVVNTVEPAIQLMAPRRRGQIAIMSSLAAFRGFSTNPAYCASKAAVKVLGEGLRSLHRRNGIGVSVICPGFVRSPMTAGNKFPMPFLMDADRAAAIIKRGLARNRPRIVFPWQLYAALWLIVALPARLTDKVDRPRGWEGRYKRDSR